MSIAVKTDTGWQVLGVGSGTPGELPGVGGWATITAVSGSPNRYAYNDGPGGVGGFDWVAFEWTADGELTSSGGLVDCWIVSSGSGINSQNKAIGGGIADGTHLAPAGTSQVTIGVGHYVFPNPSQIKQTGATFPWVMSQCSGTSSVLIERSINSTGADAWATRPGDPSGVYTSITGNQVGYSGAPGSAADFGCANPPRANSGACPATQGASSPGANGVVIVRVPAAQAAGVDPGSYNDVTVRSVAKEKAKEAVKSRKKTKK